MEKSKRKHRDSDHREPAAATTTKDGEESVERKDRGLIDGGAKRVRAEEGVEEAEDRNFMEEPKEEHNLGDLMNSSSDQVGSMELLPATASRTSVDVPCPIQPPDEPVPPPPQPLKLTKEERKKLQTQHRLSREKEVQEMIRLGLLEPPKPKVKMSNFMRVLLSEATQHPTRLDMGFRTGVTGHERSYMDRNIERKLTPDEHREKKKRKLFDDPKNTETLVSVYKINNLPHPQALFKVNIHARENKLTGCAAVISEGITVVVVEGCPKSIRRYGKVMLKRIDWAASVKKEEGEDEAHDAPVNKCLMVWKGNVAKPSFHRFSIQDCRTEAAARKIFSDAGVAHYWDLAVNFTEDQM